MNCLIFLHDFSGNRYLMSGLVVLLMWGLGGGLSYIFKRDSGEHD
jgi:hypothetical protein